MALTTICTRPPLSQDRRASCSTGSLWLKRGAISTTQVVLANGQGLDRWLSFVAADDKLKIEFPSSANGNVLNVKTGTVFSDTTAWHHVCFCFDMADVAKRFIYVDDAGGHPNIYELHEHRHRSGTLLWFWLLWSGRASEWQQQVERRSRGRLGQLYLFRHFGGRQSPQVHRRLGEAGDLGSDGSTPTGVAPIFFRHLSDGEAAANFAINRGTGGADMTITGALTTAATSPTD